MKLRFSWLFIVAFVGNAWADFDSVGPNGINSRITTFEGTGIHIGQAEGLRSSVRLNPITGDPYDSSAFSATNTRPKGIYFQSTSGFDAPNAHNGEHATTVAGVMIGTDESPPCGLCSGVAPEAHLYSIGVGDLTDDTIVALSLNGILRLSGVTLRAINMSASMEIQAPIEKPNGNSHVTQFLDWSARRYDTLHVVAWGNDDDPLERKPQDQYNGITVAGSMRMPNESVYRKFWDRNSTSGYAYSAELSDEVYERPSVHLLAPSEGITVLGWGNDVQEVAGTSYAAPHVTGAVAIVQDVAKRRIDLGLPGFTSPAAQRHEVMKAVLLNSADKLAGVHGSTRDVLDRNNARFEQNDLFEPLSRDIGAGHLNVDRALTQFISGEQNPGMVSLVGWDYQTIGGEGSQLEYIFDASASGYLAATLTWDRRVENTSGNNQVYNAGDDFFDRFWHQEINNLDLYLMPANETDLAASVWRSISFRSNTEHIFFNVPNAGEYKLVVRNACCGIGDSQNYGLAWWFGSAPPLSPPGDHNGDGSVDILDYVVWRSGGGTEDGYDDWAANYGTTSSGPGSGSFAVPEPSSFLLLGMAVGLSRLRQCDPALA